MNTQPPISNPSSPPEPNRQINSRELREWLGIMPADFLMYGALLGGGALYFVKGLMLEIGISAVSIILALLSCYFGMKHDEEVSKAANIVKKTAYPACFIILVVLLFLNFTQWNGS
jgi:hypothetical protein